VEDVLNGSSTFCKDQIPRTFPDVAATDYATGVKTWSAFYNMTVKGDVWKL